MAGHRNRFVECTISGNGTDPSAGEVADVYVGGETRGVIFERCRIDGAITTGPDAEPPAVIEPVREREPVTAGS